MDLKEIKREVDALPNVVKTLRAFQENWIMPIKENSNSHLPFIKNFAEKIKTELNLRLSELDSSLEKIKEAQMISQKLKYHSRQLIDLKLTTFNDDQSRSKIITNNMFNDDLMNVKQTIKDIKEFDTNINELHQQYHEINDLLHKQLSLEETVFFMNMPHYRYLQNLIKLSSKQKVIVREIGRHLVSLTKQTQLRRGR